MRGLHGVIPLLCSQRWKNPHSKQEDPAQPKINEEKWGKGEDTLAMGFNMQRVNLVWPRNPITGSLWRISSHKSQKMYIGEYSKFKRKIWKWSLFQNKQLIIHMVHTYGMYESYRSVLHRILKICIQQSMNCWVKTEDCKTINTVTPFIKKYVSIFVCVLQRKMPARMNTKTFTVPISKRLNCQLLLSSLLFVLVFWPCTLVDLISQTRGGISATVVTAQSSNHEATRELSSLYFFE